MKINSKIGFFLGMVLSISFPLFAATFNLFSPATGILKGNTNTYVTTAATSTDIRALWSGVCDITTFLRGDGNCALVSLTSNVSGILPVANGGSGASTLTGLLQGNGTSAFTAIANSSTVGQVLRVTGASTYGWGALSLSTAAAITGTLPVANGGTNLTASADDNIMVGNGTTWETKAVPNCTDTGGNHLNYTTATNTVSCGTSAPGGFTGFANPTASLGLTAVNGSAVTAMRSDAAPALSQSITPTWTGAHAWSGAAINTAQGSDIASAGTINLDTATGNVVDVTGTTTITAVTLSQGRTRLVRFTGTLTLTNGASLVLPGGLNITTAAGDFAVFVGYAAGVVRVSEYQRTSFPAFSSTYTPTLTNVLNTASSTSQVMNYMRVGNMVTVYGFFAATASTAPNISQIRVSLPVTSNLTLGTDLAGSGSTASTAVRVPVWIDADTTNDAALVEYLAADTASNNLFFSFSYLVK